MATAPLDVGTEVYCPACTRKVAITVPPPHGFRDPWQGDRRARVTSH